jgi:hypothetical protein
VLTVPRLVYEFTTISKRPPCCAGTIPTELGRCTAMETLQLWNNRLTGKHFCAQIARRVYEFTTTLKRPPCCAGTIPTELGRCTAMKTLTLHSNGLTGTHFCAQIARRVYQSVPRELKKTFFLRRQHSHGIRLLHSTGGALSERQRIDR